MESLQLSNAKLLYVVSELNKQGTITDTERATIKGSNPSLTSPFTFSIRKNRQ